MPYQLLILRKDWFSADVTPDKFQVLLQILNKGYAKPMAQYGLIESLRIKYHQNFLKDLQLDPASVANQDKDFAIMILVGSKSDFKRLEAHAGYIRRFNPEIYPLSGLSDSDIPMELASEFGPLTAENVEHVTLAPSARIDVDVADRVLATVGLKTYQDDGYFSDSDFLADTKHYEITGLTSFMRGTGSGIINHVIRLFFFSKPSFLKPEHVLKTVLHAIVIKEHELVPFYQKAFGFVPSTHPDILIKMAGSESPLEDGIKASRDFSITFMRKEIFSQSVDTCVV
ncbi:hypothetical protein METBIDRAFT_11272 [Metschnikowia bicuspidata var. bicuspidata NRRL YB-4993]|uniref:Uncharacterized protein n=1 Tax=Metschnikowia bicuspidata var. bicuspidata NRRL YB-4993 TaxID=869754 RepID=A0A1A0HEA2_9ASCO|nr:hypothetical protein METBIDRAFT_11272 [Metschnikowia bicuspidata var. bicuspidata NRRL YB-4993]OBA22439.1 hypothetical protein METBIDRAFT_11272 [Metschnikowia bicuspidata var. bicuspidata NRRL YB-4993]